MYNYANVICCGLSSTDSTSSFTSSPSSPIMAGDTVTLTCSVSLPSGVTDTPDFQWEGPGANPSPANPTTSGQIVSSDLTLSEIATSQAGQYTCIATLIGSVMTIMIHASVIITVQSKLLVVVFRMLNIIIIIIE